MTTSELRAMIDWQVEAKNLFDSFRAAGIGDYSVASTAPYRQARAICQEILDRMDDLVNAAQSTHL